MTPATHEPLTPEERELAQRLSRLGPHGGPSPALDARILAAAHAAAAGPRPRRRRWWALAGVPGSLVTGAGMAAALVLVVGVVWQTRPSSPRAQLPAGDGDMGYVSAEVIERSAPAAAEVAPPPPSPMEPRRELAPPAVARTAPAPESRPRAAAAKQERTAVAVAAADTGAAPAVAADAVSSDHASETYAAAPMVAATPAPAPPAQEELRARQIAAEEAAQRQQAQTLDRVEVTGSRIAAKAMAAPPPSAPAAPTSAGVLGYSGTAGAASAPTLADVPVTLDEQLDVDAWIERIRARRDSGDLDGARASLAGFRAAHPKHRLPGDLRTLAKPTR